MKWCNFFNKISLILQALGCAVLYFVIEAICRHSFTEAWTYMTTRPLVFAYNAAFIFTTMLIVYLFRKRIFWRIFVGSLWLFLGIVNVVLLLNRVTPFTGPDVKNLTDGLSIAKKYLTRTQMTIGAVLLGIAVLILLIILIRSPKYRGKLKYKVNIPLVLVGVLAFGGITQLALEKRVLSNYFGNIAFAYEDYGFPYCFAASLFNTGINQPSSYSEETMKEISNDGALTTSETSLPSEERPNIIFVQLESYFDPTEVEWLRFSEDPIPNLRKLYKEYSSGYFKVPSVGAGTANTEFEVLTGMSMRFFGPGEYPYKTYVKTHVLESAATALTSLGYGAEALHNNGGNFYSRAKVFNDMGFDHYTSKEFMNILKTTPKGWATDDILVPNIMESMDTTAGQDFVFTVSVQGHGDYPTEPTLENPEIKVTGVEDEGKRNAWEYYVNEVHEMDKFVAQLIEAVEARNEPSVVVFYGDHLPTLGLEAKDLKSKYLYNTNYVIWDNIGLQKKDGNIAAYQIMAEVFDRLDIHSGTIFNYHQQRNKTKHYLSDLELLQYDIMYGKQYAYEKNGAPITEGHMVMGVKDAEIKDVVTQLNGDYSIYGANFTKQSKVYINDEKQDTKFMNNTRLDLKDSELKDGDTIMVAQVGSSNTIFRTSKTYEYKDGKLSEVVETDDSVENGRQAFTDQEEKKD